MPKDETEYEKFYAECCDGHVRFTGGEPTGDGLLIGEVKADVMFAMLSGKPQELFSKIVDALPESVLDELVAEVDEMSTLINAGLDFSWRPRGFRAFNNHDDTYSEPVPEHVMLAAEQFILFKMDFDRISAWMLNGEFEDNPADPDYADSCEFKFLKAITTPEGREEYRGYMIDKLNEWGPVFVDVTPEDLRSWGAHQAAQWLDKQLEE